MIDFDTLEETTIPAKATRTSKPNPLLNKIRELHSQNLAGSYVLSTAGSPSDLDRVKTLIRRAAGVISQETGIELGSRTSVEELDEPNTVKLTFWIAPKRGYEVDSNGGDTTGNRKRK